MNPLSRQTITRSRQSSAFSENEHLANILSMLWPEPCTIGVRRSPDAGSGGLAYVAVPNWSSPAVIAPRRPRRIMAATLRGYNTAATGRSRAKAQLSALAASTGVADLIFPSVLIDDTAADSDSSIRKYLAEVLGQDVSLSISIGPRRAVQKPVIQIVGADGRQLAFAKVGQNALTRDLVEREARNLRRLAATLDPGVGVQVPTVLAAEVWRDSYVLVQSTLARGYAPDRRALVAGLNAVARVDGVHQTELSTSSYWSTLRGRVDRLSGTGAADSLKSAITCLDAGLPSTLTCPFGSWHGDLTPWNITASEGGLRIWDWEHYAPEVPVGFDLLHYDIRVRQDRMSPVDAVRTTFESAAQTLRPLGVLGPVASWIAVLYLIEIATRYVEDGEQDGQTKMGGLAWLEPSLRSQLAELCGATW